ncbi:hypothetical protein KQH60_13505 [Mycetohabitans sp. B8]|uniref:PhaM family polyhydroxyalkanoate granule multifunctional regulatory protein n=1 Tax=Mycetohabitans sp. B8 TaxID=2841845 RepID=UPI001F311D3D|nr:PhaM family polyhydroxyalkanoate granule multifunctional regulatory protein [Mycetohabitans sp. B8]MCG1043497.1 hypothetical protein [Mycetohabitans sp. B8]
MSDSGGNTPFLSFPQFSPNAGYEMFDSLLKLMGVPGDFAHGGAPASSPLGLGPDIVAPLMSVEELDKRITDLRAVEQWLKLNLSMLQSTIQALQVQRSTLATLRAFSAFTQASMMPAPDGTSNASRPSGESGISGDARGARWSPPDAVGQADKTNGGADDARRTRSHTASAADDPLKQAAAVDPFAFARAFYDVASGAVKGAMEGAAGATGPADADPAAPGEASPQRDAPAAHGAQAPPAGEPVVGQWGPDTQRGAPADRRAPGTSRGKAAGAAAAADAGERAAASRAGEPLDASAWWNLLQTQFEQIVRIAAVPHRMSGASVSADEVEEAMRQRVNEGLGRSSPGASAGVGQFTAKARSSTAARAPSKRAAAAASGSTTKGGVMAESGTSAAAGKSATHSGSAKHGRPAAKDKPAATHSELATTTGRKVPTARNAAPRGNATGGHGRDKQ